MPSAGHTRYLPAYLYLFVIHRPPTHGAADPPAINSSADSFDWFVGQLCCNNGDGSSVYLSVSLSALNPAALIYSDRKH